MHKDAAGIPWQAGNPKPFGITLTSCNHPGFTVVTQIIHMPS